MCCHSTRPASMTQRLGRKSYQMRMTHQGKEGLSSKAYQFFLERTRRHQPRKCANARARAPKSSRSLSAAA
eukprot:6190398-Pleurochrysis_carterae.AAC.6